MQGDPAPGPHTRLLLAPRALAAPSLLVTALRVPSASHPWVRTVGEREKVSGLVPSPLNFFFKVEFKKQKRSQIKYPPVFLLLQLQGWSPTASHRAAGTARAQQRQDKGTAKSQQPLHPTLGSEAAHPSTWGGHWDTGLAGGACSRAQPSRRVQEGAGRLGSGAWGRARQRRVRRQLPPLQARVQSQRRAAASTCTAASIGAVRGCSPRAAATRRS